MMQEHGVCATCPVFSLHAYPHDDDDDDECLSSKIEMIGRTIAQSSMDVWIGLHSIRLHHIRSKLYGICPQGVEDVVAGQLEDERLRGSHH